MSLRFKAGRSFVLLDELERCDLRLKLLALAVMGFVDRHFRKDVVVTEIYRTEAQQRSYYPGQPYKPSVHQFGRGIDFGIREYQASELDPWPHQTLQGVPALKPGEIAYLDAFFSAVISYDDERPEYDSMVHHNVGLGDHLHMQVSWRATTRLRSDRGRLQLVGQQLGVTL